jgi:hypothetical protein
MSRHNGIHGRTRLRFIQALVATPALVEHRDLLLGLLQALVQAAILILASTR